MERGMTPSQLETAARMRYNAVGDTFWTQQEMLDLIYHAEMEMAQECHVIQNTYTASTVASQQAYAWPTNAIGIKRITLDGTKLFPIDMRDDDILTLANQAITSTGTPSHYYLWEKSIYLRPIPAVATHTIKIFSYDMPGTLLITSTLDVPTEYHNDLMYFVLAEMALKDGNSTQSEKYRAIWENRKKKATALVRARLRGDAPAAVKDIDSVITSGLGQV
jgi:hypothetical protein